MHPAPPTAPLKITTRRRKKARVISKPKLRARDKSLTVPSSSASYSSTEPSADVQQMFPELAGASRVHCYGETAVEYAPPREWLSGALDAEHIAADMLHYDAGNQQTAEQRDMDVDDAAEQIAACDATDYSESSPLDQVLAHPNNDPTTPVQTDEHGILGGPYQAS